MWKGWLLPSDFFNAEMKKMCIVSGSLLITFLISTSEAYAAQSHNIAEGLCVHQVAHALFAIAMLSLIVRLQLTKAVKDRGWRYIQIAAFFFLLWNLDNILVHWMAELIPDSLFHGSPHNWSQRLELTNWTARLFYWGRLDWLLSVPALFYL